MSLPRVHVPHLSDELHEWLLDNRALLLSARLCCCDWCGHDWHARPCARDCRCDTSRARLDDTWRPILGFVNPDQARRICHDTGVDGWVGLACAGITTPLTIPSPGRLKRLVYGTGPDE